MINLALQIIQAVAMQEKLSSAVTTLNSDNEHLILQETLPRTCDDFWTMQHPGGINFPKSDVA